MKTEQERVEMDLDVEEHTPRLFSTEDQFHRPESGSKKKGFFANTIFTIKEWRRLQREIRGFPELVDEQLVKIWDELGGYRLSMVGLSYKSEEVDDEVWGKYTRIIAEIPILKEQTFRRPLALNRKSRLEALWSAWGDLMARQDQLLEILSKAPEKLEDYNRLQIMRKQDEQDRRRLEEEKLKIAAAQQLLEIALGEVEEKNPATEMVLIGSRFLSFEDARMMWQEQYERIRQMQKMGITNADDVLMRIRRLEETIREAPISARWIRGTEEKYAQLIADHDLLVSMGKSVIPQAEVARTRVMMYEQVPELWATGDHEGLGRTLQGVEKFIDFYSGSIKLELEIAERRRPGITRALATARLGGSDGLLPLIQVTRTLVNAVDSRDRYMKGHSQTVTELSLKTARKLNWSEADLEHLELAALLHDVGKLSVPETILSKTTPLTQEERKIIELHPLYGANIIKPVDSLHNIIPWVYHHQEKWDGTGYPDRLAKKEIPQAASIIAIAEAFSVMTLDLPYHQASTKDEVLANIESEAGRQFDPEVAEAFVEATSSSSPGK